MNSFSIRGVIVPILTPFTEGGDELDVGALQAHAQWLVAKGVHGLMACGTTGEAALLAPAERRRVLEVVVGAAAGRVPVLAQVGTASTRETVALGLHAQDAGATALSVVTPYYYRLSDQALVVHCCRVAEAVAATPIFLYSIPQNAGNSFSAAVAEAIVARCPNVVGIKDSSGDLSTLASFTKVNRGHFQVACGSDHLIVRALRAGARASVSGNANVFPELLVALLEAFWRQDWRLARRRQTQLDQISALLAKGDSPSLMKRGLELRGLRGGAVRPPLLEATAEMVADLQRSLRALQLLG